MLKKNKNNRSQGRFFFIPLYLSPSFAGLKAMKKNCARKKFRSEPKHLLLCGRDVSEID